jgi:hypothetical protein
VCRACRGCRWPCRGRPQLSPHGRLLTVETLGVDPQADLDGLDRLTRRPGSAALPRRARSGRLRAADRTVWRGAAKRQPPR